MDDKAPGLEIANNQNPEPYAPAYHTKKAVPHPCNSQAEKVQASKVMRQVMDAK